MEKPNLVNLKTSEQVRRDGWHGETRDADGHLIRTHGAFERDEQIAEFVREALAHGETVTIWPSTASTAVSPPKEEPAAGEVDPWVIIEKLRLMHRDEIHSVWMPLAAELREANTALQQLVDEKSGLSAEEVLSAAVEEYTLQHPVEDEAERAGRRAAARGMMMRLGVYSKFADVTKGMPPLADLSAEPTALDGPFEVSRSSDGVNSWFSARDPAWGVSIPQKSREHAVALVNALNAAISHHIEMAKRKRDSDGEKS